MGKHHGQAFAFSDIRATNATRLAQSVRRDFSDLVVIFDRQLGRLTDADREARSHMVRAKAAAERGLRLSQDLIEALRA